MGNPRRGCGTKKDDSFYLEADMGVGGTLDPWTWVIGDGVDNVIFGTVPPRRVVAINPAATLADQELVLYNELYIPGDIYTELLKSTRDIGVGDHVGKDNYSARSFADECIKYGPSRRITEQDACVYGEMIRNFGPLPIMVTHDRIPVFSSEFDREKAYEATKECLLAESEDDFTPTWQKPNWGQFADQDNGGPHPIIGMLRVVDRLDRNWKEFSDYEVYRKAREVFNKVSFVEQPFGLTWITKVTYTLPKDKDVRKEILDIPGINLLDLDNCDIEEDTLVGEINVQAERYGL